MADNEDILTPAGFRKMTRVPRETLDILKIYADRLADWQKQINLVGGSTLPDLWRRHMLDSAQLAAPISERFGSKRATILDLGSGAGFPGLVLAAMGVGDVHLVESDQRKCTFLGDVMRRAEIFATVHNKRVEHLTSFHVDVVTARALAPVDTLFDLSRAFHHPKLEFWLLKGQHVDEELTRAAISWSMEVEELPSLSDPQGRIVVIRNLQKKGQG